MSKDKAPFRVFSEHPDVPVPPAARTRTPAMKAVDDMFLAEARKAFAGAGCTALQFLAENPLVSKIELAKRLAQQSGCGTRAIGLTKAIYDEAVQSNAVRTVAKDLLYRKILQEFPDGWFVEPNICASVKIGDWDYDIHKYVPDKQAGDAAFRIVKQLTIEEPPPDGWKPSLPNDPRIEELFARLWPAR